MQYDEFVGQVQHRARLASGGEAIRAIHATLETLAERLYGGEADDLAAQLPREIQPYLQAVASGKDFDLKEFYERVSSREEIDLPESIYHARAVMSVVMDAVSAGEIQDILAQLPEEYCPLFQWEEVKAASTVNSEQ